MPSYFGRFRLLNDTPEDDTDPTKGTPHVVTSLTFKIGTPEVLYTVVGYGTPFLSVPPQYYAELDLPEGTAMGDKVTVDMTVTDPANPASPPLTVTDWVIDIDSAVLLRSVDIKLLYRANGTVYRVRATAAGANYAFKEPTESLPYP